MRYWGLVTCLLCSCSALRHGDADGLTASIAEIMVTHHAYEQAVPLLQRALAKDPNQGRNYILMGMVLRDQGLWQQGEAYLRRGIALSPLDVDGHSALAVLFDRQGQSEKAEAHHLEALRLQPNRAELYNNLGFSWYLRGDANQAIVYYHQALTFDPHLRRTYNNLGFALAKLRQFEQAAKMFDKAGPPAEALNNLAIAYEMMGEYTLAARTYARAASMRKGSEKARKNLLALQALGYDGAEGQP